MKSVLWQIGQFKIHGYGLMIAIGIISAYLTVEYRAKKKGLKYDLIFDLTIWCAAGGILGAKLLYLITQIKNIIADPKILLQVSDGFVVYGGILGGILVGYLFIKKHKLDFFTYFDLVMPSIALAQGFGRIGCTFAGCCYGIETTSPLGLIFPESSMAPSGIRLFPTQPISSALDFLNFFVLVLISKKTKATGQVAGFYLIFYSAGRFIIEFFRGDLIRGTVGILSTSQFISVFLFLAGIGIVVIRGLQGKKAHASASAEETEETSDQENEE